MILRLYKHWDDTVKTDSYSFTGPASLINGKIEEVKDRRPQERFGRLRTGCSWTSFQTKYFLSVVVPGEKALERAQVLRDGDAIENLLETPYFSLLGGEQVKLDYLVYIGPKDPQLLKAAGHQLDEVVHFGFFNILAQPLFMVSDLLLWFFQKLRRVYYPADRFDQAPLLALDSQELFIDEVDAEAATGNAETA